MISLNGVEDFCSYSESPCIFNVCTYCKEIFFSNLVFFLTILLIIILFLIDIDCLNKYWNKV